MNECLRCGNRWTDKRLHCPKCGLEREVVTNADRIRKMSDDELAKLFSEKTSMRHMSSIWLDWLKQEVE